jgi:hypothetical protein
MFFIIPRIRYEHFFNFCHFRFLFSWLERHRIHAVPTEWEGWTLDTLCVPGMGTHRYRSKVVMIPERARDFLGVQVPYWRVAEAS